MMRERCRPLSWPGPVFVLVLLVCRSGRADFDDAEDLDETVIWCEDAIAKLGRCCPGFVRTSISCRDEDYDEVSQSQGCDGIPRASRTFGHDLPAFTRDDSACIRAKSCEELFSSGTCTRAARALPRGKHETDQVNPDNARGSSGYPILVADRQDLPPVCP
jgi:hypothetical protein